MKPMYTESEKPSYGQFDFLLTFYFPRQFSKQVNATWQSISCPKSIKI